MKKEEIETILKSILEEENMHFDPPTPTDWRNLEEKISCTFGEDFKMFIEFMSKYSFPGEILNVSTGTTNGNDSISSTYDYEINTGNWNRSMIPFYSIGNGDYFCLSAIESPSSSIYYFYHEDFRYELYTKDFESWLKALPEFLS